MKQTLCLATLGYEGKLKMNMDETINVKELRASLPDVVRRVRSGQRFTVLYRSRPAFRIVPVDEADVTSTVPLSSDALYGAEALGTSTDGLSSEDHDALLYGNGRR
jgi:prevent-host-death family protein